MQTIEAEIINPNQALRIRAVKELTDSSGKNRVTGEEWMVESNGAYLPGVFERVVSRVDAFIITDKSALHLRAKRTFTDKYVTAFLALCAPSYASTHPPALPCHLCMATIHHCVALAPCANTLLNAPWTRLPNSSTISIYARTVTRNVDEWHTLLLTPLGLIARQSMATTS
jgi:hypothetical protein